jgi:hypothetical protein
MEKIKEFLRDYYLIILGCASLLIERFDGFIVFVAIFYINIKLDEIKEDIKWELMKINGLIKEIKHD